MRAAALFSPLVQTLLLVGTISHAEELGGTIFASPDGSAFVAWADVDAGAPLGLIRPIVFRWTDDPHPYFSIVSTPRQTSATWNATSTCCVLADAPDNGGPRIWLIRRHEEEPVWGVREVRPFTILEEEFHRSHRDATLFRLSVLGMEWTSDFQLSIRGYCNLGTYLLTLDVRNPEAPPDIRQLSDELLEE